MVPNYSDCQKASALQNNADVISKQPVARQARVCYNAEKRWNNFGFLPSNLAKREGTTGAVGAGPQTQEERA